MAATKRGQPNVQARASLVIDETGAQVFAHNPDKERPIASISKLAAVLVVMDKGLELEGLSTINKTDVEVAKGGAKSRLLEGMTLSNRDLLHAALMGSDNRAMPALGRAVKLTPSQLGGGMNAKAKQLGLKNTRFLEPTGLSVSNVSTPREMIAMLQAGDRAPGAGADHAARGVRRAPGGQAADQVRQHRSARRAQQRAAARRQDRLQRLRALLPGGRDEDRRAHLLHGVPGRRGEDDPLRRRRARRRLGRQPQVEDRDRGRDAGATAAPPATAPVPRAARDDRPPAARRRRHEAGR